MSIWPWGNKEVKLDLEDERTYKLLMLSTIVCRHCEHFRQDSCSQQPEVGSPEADNFSWSQQSACDDWSPNPLADEALQLLTMRKLEGEDIEYVDPRQKKKLDNEAMFDEATNSQGK